MFGLAESGGATGGGRGGASWAAVGGGAAVNATAVMHIIRTSITDK